MAVIRARLFKVATILLAASFFVQAITVIGMVFFREPALRAGILSALSEIHEYNGFLFTALVLVHLYLNWGWVKANILKKRGV